MHRFAGGVVATPILAYPPGTLHTDVNVGNEPIEVMVVEVKDDR